MIVELSGYRVFIGSPGGLREEREAFRNALIEFNDAHAVAKKAIFLPVGWEDTPGGMGRAQDHINEKVRECDYCVIVLYNWWGTPPAKDGKYQSGTEEEFHVAVACKKDPEMPMRDVKIFFKAVDAVPLGDPGVQLSKVLAFKKKLEKDREHHYEMFDDVATFERKLRRHLGDWLRAHEDGSTPVPGSPPVFADTIHTTPVVGTSPDEQRSLEEAWRLASAGRRTEAEAVFAKEVVSGGSAAAFLAYGRFLRLDGRLNQAGTMLTKALDLAAVQGSRPIEADVHLELGLVSYADENIARAEESYRAALDLNVDLNRAEGIADTKRNLGLVLVRKRELEEAEALYREALTIDEGLGRLDGMADDYSHLGSALQHRGDLAGAEEMHRAALEIDKNLERLDAVAKHYGDLGSVRYMQSDWAGAEEMYQEALQLDERLGRMDGMADDYSNLGSVMFAQGDFDRARKMHEAARDIDERLERFEGVVDHYENLAMIEESLHRYDEAEAFRELSRAARERAESA